MNYYRCPTCYSTFSEAELTTFKCSENYVGPEIAMLCPKCLRKRKSQRFSRLKKIEYEDALEGRLEDINAKLIEMSADLKELKAENSELHDMSERKLHLEDIWENLMDGNSDVSFYGDEGVVEHG